MADATDQTDAHIFAFSYVDSGSFVFALGEILYICTYIAKGCLHLQ